MTGQRYTVFTTAKRSILAGFALLFVLGGSAIGAEVHLGWDANTESDLAGYVIYYGTESRNYQFSRDVGNVTEYTLTDLTEGQTYYLAATAYDVDRNHSDYSDEVVHQVPTADDDGDGLSNSSEINVYHTNPQAADTDNDGLSDGAEVQTYRTDPLEDDSDGDGLLDGAEINTYQTDPLRTDSDGDGLSDYAEVMVHHSDPTRADSDGDGIDDPTELQVYYTDPMAADSDGDGLDDGVEVNTYGTDPMIADSDNDGLSDGAEVQTYGTDPLDSDSDQDGLSDGYEISEGLDPNNPEGNRPPAQPVLVAPADGFQDAELAPVLETGTFSDPDSGDYHSQTQWRVSTTADFSTLVFSLTSDRYLTALQLPESLLDTAQTYYWQVRFYDRAQEPSDWSNAYRFTTVAVSANDVNQNGIPDDQEVDDTTDLDENQTPDVQQSDMKVVRVVTGDGRIAIKGSSNVTSIETMRSIPEEYITEEYARPEDMPFDMISFRFHVAQPGDTAEITIYFSDPAPEGSKWYKYDLENGWQDYSAYAVFSANRKKLTLSLTDGGRGDGDGVVNGVILDPSGLGSTTVSTSVEDVDSDDLVAKLEDVFAGCFIASANGPQANTSLSPRQYLVAGAFAAAILILALLRLVVHAMREKVHDRTVEAGELRWSQTGDICGKTSTKEFLNLTQPRSMPSPR